MDGSEKNSQDGEGERVARDTPGPTDLPEPSEPFTIGLTDWPKKIRERRIAVLTMRLRGLFQGTIAEKLGISIGTVCQDLKVMFGLYEQLVLARTGRQKSCDVLRAQRIAALEALLIELHEEFDRSKGGEKVETFETTEGRAVLDKTGDIIELPALKRVKRVKKEKAGSAALAMAIVECHKEYNRILGVHAPQKVDVESSHTMVSVLKLVMDDEERRRREGKAVHAVDAEWELTDGELTSRESTGGTPAARDHHTLADNTARDTSAPSSPPFPPSVPPARHSNVLDMEAELAAIERESEQQAVSKQPGVEESDRSEDGAL